jgi:hypothetical protein
MGVDLYCVQENLSPRNKRKGKKKLGQGEKKEVVMTEVNKHLPVVENDY